MNQIELNTAFAAECKKLKLPQLTLMLRGANSDRKEYLQKLIAEKKGEADKSKSLEELVAELSKL